jgi:hypothetical protein
MNDYLVNLLLKIHNFRMQSNHYVYKPDNFTNPEDALREEDGLLELRDTGYIKIIEIKNNMRHSITRFLTVLVKDITPKGNNFIRAHLAKENLKPLQETIKTVPNIYQQTQSHLIQARQHIASINDERSRKDAVRDCLSAMEALVKQISGINDVRDAIEHIKKGDYGPKPILRDGRSLWDRVHELYPDVRHGAGETSNITEAEALYWIERILAFVNYLARVGKNNQQSA